MGDDVSCPACGRLMLPTTGGYFCPACRHRSNPSTIFEEGPPTPPLGLRVAPPQPETVFDPSLRPEGAADRRPAGGSIFDSDPRLGPAAGSRPSGGLPASGGYVVEPQITFADDDGERGAFGDTVVIPGQKRGTPAPGKEDEVSSVLPEKKEALFLPRCRSCNEVLELEEIADGECARCRAAGGPVGRGEKRRRRAPAGPPAGAAIVASGTLAALAATWAGVLVVTRAVQSNPDAWDGPRLLMESWRIGLVLFALAVSIMWACGRAWAGGAGVALGALAAALAAVMVLDGALVDNIHVASAWMLAGAAGALAALSALVPRREFAGVDGHHGGRAAGRRRPRSTDEALAAPSRRSRRDAFGVSRVRAVLGGLVALGAAGVAGWQAKLAFDAAPGAARAFGPGALRIYGLGAAAAASGFVALWLIVRPPRGRTHVLALCAAVVAAPLPAWLVIGPRVAELAGLGTIDGGGWLALPAGLGRLLGVEALAELAPVSVAVQLEAAAAAALGIGLVASMIVLLTRSAARGRGLAGLALACVLLWGAGLSTALVPQSSPAAEPASVTVAADAAQTEPSGGQAPPSALPSEDGAAF